MIRRVAGTAFVAVLMAVLALAGAGTASAHAIRISTDPAQDAALGQGPARVSACRAGAEITPHSTYSIFAAPLPAHAMTPYPRRSVPGSMPNMRNDPPPGQPMLSRTDSSTSMFEYTF